MDIPHRNGKYITVRELRMLKDAGIETAMYFSLHWDKFEPQPGEFDEDYFSDIIDRYTLAGMKIILPLWTTQSSKLPPAWYCRQPDGSWPKRGFDREYIISPWSDDGQAYFNQTLELVKAKYASDKVMIMATGIRDGESVMPSEALYYGSDALVNWRRNHKHEPNHNVKEALEWIKAGYVNMVYNRQKALGGEFWFNWHFRKASLPSPFWGCQWVDDYMAAIMELQPEQINHVSFAHWPYEDQPGRVKRFMEKWHSNEWVGAEYCTGLRDGNAQRAKDAGLRGLILAPCHPYTPYTAIEPWMLAEIEKAIRLWD